MSFIPDSAAVDPVCASTGAKAALLTPVTGRARPWLMPLLPAVLAIAVCFALYLVYLQASEARALSIPETLGKWTPLLAQGMVLNLVIVSTAMALGTLAGLFFGLLASSKYKPLRRGVWIFTQFFRNTPSLVILFFAAFMLPFSISAFGIEIPFPDWVKATLGFSLKVMGNVVEIVRGAIRSVPAAQWEAAESLAMTHNQAFWRVIFPQCIKRMLPPWMNLYSITFTATPLAAILGVHEALGYTIMALGSETRYDLVIPLYLYVMAWFFVLAHPIHHWTKLLEKRFALKG
ncbi:amino acid ABC transporter permease [Noviherbaspirillum sp.]|jgi:polar amino acid transport system permease protein|uniref:amino acid ABC transporter permease n=1 Tax=Noviherbaspirillum sp. TaxID=1926288 RepID=UPI0025D73DA3|nr:amino acid ABC transporter permease [Noviherbaspirillum sp.]